MSEIQFISRSVHVTQFFKSGNINYIHVGILHPPSSIKFILLVDKISFSYSSYINMESCCLQYCRLIKKL